MPWPPVLLGLTGRKGSGKDTVFRLLREEADDLGLVVSRRGFADLLKLSFCRIFEPFANVEDAVAWCDKLKVDGYVDATIESGVGEHLTGRLALQRYGTEAHREVFGEDFWIDALLPLGNPFRSEPFGSAPWVENFLVDGAVPSICVVTDVRFDNEASRVVDAGGRIARVLRHGADTTDDHSSESGVDDSLVAYEIFNDQSIDDMRPQVRSLLARTRAGFR